MLNREGTNPSPFAVPPGQGSSRPEQASPSPFHAKPPRNPRPSAWMAPALFTALSARNASTPPVVPSQGAAARLPAAFTVTEVYSGTRMACVPVAVKLPVSGCVKVSRVAVRL